MKIISEDCYPKITILLATQNRAHLIEETLVSIQNQTYPNFQCYITDDRSTDNTATVVKAFCEKDDRFHYFLKPEIYPEGLSATRNFGLDLAEKNNVTYIQFFDDDDIVHPENLSICIDFLESERNDFCRYLRSTFRGEFEQDFDDQENYKSFKIWGKLDVSKMITNQLPFNSCAVMWRKDCFRHIRFNENLHYAEEWECYQRILSEGFSGISIDKVLYYARKHSESNTGEFWNGNKKRFQSQIEASKLVVDNLVEKELFSQALIRYFGWQSVQLNSIDLLAHLLNHEGISSLHKCKVLLRYKFSPIIKIWLRLKKSRL